MTRGRGAGAALVQVECMGCVYNVTYPAWERFLRMMLKDEARARDLVGGVGWSCISIDPINITDIGADEAREALDDAGLLGGMSAVRFEGDDS